MELTKKRKKKEVLDKKQTTIKYRKMHECSIFIENKWQKGVMIHCKPQENYFTIIQFDTLELHFLFPKVIISLIHDYYFKGYQIAIHINDLVISPTWKNDDDINLPPLIARNNINYYELKCLNYKSEFLCNLESILFHLLFTEIPSIDACDLTKMYCCGQRYKPNFPRSYRYLVLPKTEKIIN